MTVELWPAGSFTNRWRVLILTTVLHSWLWMKSKRLLGEDQHLENPMHPVSTSSSFIQSLFCVLISQRMRSQMIRSFTLCDVCYCLYPNVRVIPVAGLHISGVNSGLPSKLNRCWLITFIVPGVITMRTSFFQIAWQQFIPQSMLQSFISFLWSKPSRVRLFFIIPITFHATKNLLIFFSMMLHQESLSNNWSRGSDCMHSERCRLYRANYYLRCHYHRIIPHILQHHTLKLFLGRRLNPSHIL